MTNTWDGRPQNPERDGLHYITDAVAFWEAGRQKWRLLSHTRLEDPEWLAAQSWAEYRGPCPTLKDIEARIPATRRDALEEAAALCARRAAFWSRMEIKDHEYIRYTIEAGDCAEAIRNLKGGAR